uniref:Uncharacterized protein n=1 Tax=Candidatus Kentrum sp. TUN TaxID=2126343 RepID=A0A450ZVV7_9GAMM|nr:MAG: hypothetical protein BECKTUN1418D_GA0071000_10722 [Candidatus Kentron sp. TUN]
MIRLTTFISEKFNQCKRHVLTILVIHCLVQLSPYSSDFTEIAKVCRHALLVIQRFIQGKGAPLVIHRLVRISLGLGDETEITKGNGDCFFVL